MAKEHGSEYCVYRHIRKDALTPFYVGAGLRDRPRKMGRRKNKSECDLYE